MEIIKLFRLYDATHYGPSLKVLSRSKTHGQEIDLTSNPNIFESAFATPLTVDTIACPPQFVKNLLRYTISILFAPHCLRIYNLHEEFSNGFLEPPMVLRIIWAVETYRQPGWLSIRHR
jgi:hypothetical protein